MAASKPRDTRNKGVTRLMVMQAATDLLAEAGMGALSMRKVAMRLGVSPTALYNHVQSKEDLLALVADQLRGQIVVDEDDQPRAQLLSLLTQLRDLGAKHPNLLEGTSALATSRYAAELAVLELRLLRDLGLTAAQIRVAYQGLVLLVNGAAVVWRAAAEAPSATSSLRALIDATADPQDRQLLSDVDAARPEEDPEDAFALAVDQVLRAAAGWAG